MHEVTYSLDPRPTTSVGSKRRPCEVGQFLCVAVTAPVEKWQNVVRQFVHLPLAGTGRHLVGTSAVLDEEFAVDFQKPRRSDQAGPNVAERIVTLAGHNAW